MIRFILGPSGSGKTKWLIDQANEDKREGRGNIVFIDTDDSHIFTLDHQVRLINAKDYGIINNERLYGFLSGIMSRDYDIEKIYIDGIYDIIDFEEESLEELALSLENLGKIANVNIFLGMNFEEVEKIPSKYQDSAVVLHEN